MKQLLALLLLLTLCIGLVACGEDATPTQAPTEAATEAPTEAPTETTEYKPIQSVAGDPVSTGSGCQPGPEDFAE